MERTQRRARPASLAALLLAAPLTVATLPAQAAPETSVYDALGDSYAAGSGVLTEQAHPSRLDGRMRILLDDFAAVPGATVQTMLDLESGQLDALDVDTDLVTVSIGGNNIGWGQAVGACVTMDDTTCAWALTQTSGTIQTVLPPLLDVAYAQIRAAAPDAHVVVTGYPRLFSPEYGAYFNATPAEQMAMNDGADLLNEVIAAAAQRHGFQFVDVSGRFDGHGVNATEPWILGLEHPARFHPTVEGQDAYAATLTSQISPRSLR